MRPATVGPRRGSRARRGRLRGPAARARPPQPRVRALPHARRPKAPPRPSRAPPPARTAPARGADRRARKARSPRSAPPPAARASRTRSSPRPCHARRARPPAGGGGRSGRRAPRARSPRRRPRARRAPRGARARRAPPRPSSAAGRRLRGRAPEGSSGSVTGSSPGHARAAASCRPGRTRWRPRRGAPPRDRSRASSRPRAARRLQLSHARTEPCTPAPDGQAATCRFARR